MPAAKPQPSRASTAVAEPAAPAFQRIKDFVLAQIQSGEWQQGQAVPGEEALARTFAVSRMTVNRAMRELSDSGVVVRVQGSGTFVAQSKHQSTIVEIRNIADEVAARGHRHRSELHRLERCKADAALAAQFQLPPGHALFHSVVVHFEDDVAIQAEDRYVNPAVAPDYLDMDFRTQTPNEYLMRVAPLQSVKFVIEAQAAPASVNEMLQMEAREPCLVLRRQTFSNGQVASVATLWHPASRYQFAGSF